MNIDLDDLLCFLYFLQEHYQIDLIDNSGRRNRYPAEEGERLLKLLEIYKASLK